MNDEYYRNGLKNSSHEIFEDLFNVYFAKLCSYALRFLQYEEDAIDIVQRCFVKLWEKRNEADNINSFRAYLYKSVYNKSLNFLRSEQCKKKYVSHEGYCLAQTYAKDFENTYTEDLQDKLLTELENLPEKNKNIFKLRYLEGYNTKEVSEILGISKRSVESYISRSLKMLRDKFSLTDAVTLYLILSFSILPFTGVGHYIALML